MGHGDAEIEEALRRSEQRCRLLVENIPGSVILLFDHDLRIVLVDGPEVTASGSSKAAMEGKLPRECLPLPFAELVEANFRRVLAGERFSVERPWEDRVYRYEYLPLVDERGVVLHGLVVGQNVTDQHQAAAALRASEQRFRALFDAGPDAFILHDLTGRLLDGNHAAEALFGLDRKAVVGRPFLEVGKFTTESMGPFAAALTQIREGKATGPMEVRFLRADGVSIDLEVKAVPLQLHEETVVLVAARDITDRIQVVEDRRRLEEQLHHAMKMDAIGRLAGGIAHDFNNLLTAILSNVELAMVDLAPDDQRRLDLAEALHASQRAAGVVEQLLAFSRKQKIKPTVVELNDLIAGCTRLVSRLLGPSVNVIEIRSQRLVWVEVDAGKLEQVLVNLAINARDAMPDGGELRLSTDVVEELPDAPNEPAVRTGPYALLRVTDTGTGMSPDTLAHLFEPFFTTKPTGKGTGLGLSIAYGIITQSNGHIRVRSRIGLGTTFEIYLPVAEAQAPQSEPVLAPATHARGHRILVVEDDEQVRRTLERCLLRQGCIVASMSSPEAALDYASMLVTDLGMPRLDGISLYEQILVTRPALPALFISGYADPKLMARAAHHLHHTRLLQKPFSVEEFLQQVRDLVGVPETTSAHA